MLLQYEPVYIFFGIYMICTLFMALSSAIYIIYVFVEDSSKKIHKYFSVIFLSITIVMFLLTSTFDGFLKDNEKNFNMAEVAISAGVTNCMNTNVQKHINYLINNDKFFKEKYSK